MTWPPHSYFTFNLCPFALPLRQGTALRLRLSSSKGQGERARVPPPHPFALSLSKCHRVQNAGFDKLSPNGLFALTAKA
jgi:hypothetical protein